MKIPILYSFRRCPYAIRARLALAVAKVPCQLIEVSLRNKPASLLEASPKATVPVLVLSDGAVIEQSLDIVQWALNHHDPAHWLRPTVGGPTQMMEWVAVCDSSFKQALDQYKYPHRHPGKKPHEARDAASAWLVTLDQRLAATGHLQGGHTSLVDACVFPFVRQFAAVDPVWWEKQPWPCLHAWLERWLGSALFMQIMRKDVADISISGWRDLEDGFVQP